MIQGISPQPWRETGQFLWADAAWPMLTGTPIFLPEMTSPPSALTPSRLSLAAVVVSSFVPGSLGQWSRRNPLCAEAAAEPPSAPVGQAGTSTEPAIGSPSSFPVFELRTATVYSPTRLSSVYVLPALLERAEERGGSAELIRLVSSLAHSPVIQESCCARVSPSNIFTINPCKNLS